jgi:uncharacterized protein (TIGR03437 family)
VDFQVPSNVATGIAKVIVSSNGASQTAGNIQVSAVAPGLFTLNNAGLATAYAVRVTAGGTQAVQQTYSMASNGTITPNPINLGAATDQVYLVLYGTGFDAATLSKTTATVNGVNATVLYAGPGGGFAGLDQVNILLPATLAGKGNVNIQLAVAGIAANPVQITVQ